MQFPANQLRQETRRLWAFVLAAVAGALVTMTAVVVQLSA